MLSGEVQQVSEQLARATVYLLMDELVRYPASEQPYHLARIVRDKRFGFPVHLLQVKELDLDDDQRRRVVEGDTVMALGKDGDSIRIFAGILDTPWVLELGPLFQMNPYPPQLLLLLGALCLSFIGLITYLLVRRLEQRLRSLEAAATRIARGSLDTRVEVRGGDSVGRLGAAFNHMAEHIHRLLTVQREMVRAVSHELRTPVARLRFGLEMIETAETDGARLKYLEGMDNDIQDLDKLVDEMLTYARLEQGSPPLTYQRLELGVLVRQVVEEIAPLRREVLVSCEEGALVPEELGSWIEAEPRYLHRALQNLLTNALRHADRRVRISYRVSLERCRVDVEDDGPGCRRRNGSGSLRHSYAWTTAGPVLPAGMAWDCPSSGGSSTGMAAGPPSAAARLWAAPASPWPGRARQVCATAEKLTEIWRLAICKCLRRRIPGVAKTYRKASPAGRGGYSARG